MNFEILSAEILNNETHTFTFNKRIDQFVVGFSKFLIEFPDTAHHIQKIMIDLTNVDKKEKEITITPKFQMSDSTNHTESCDSKVKVVVLAATGYKNTNIEMQNKLRTNVDYVFPIYDPTFILTSLTYSSVQFEEEEDHHLNKFESKIETVPNSSTFNLNGYSKIMDSGKNVSSGDVRGSVFFYNGKNMKVLGSNFSSEKDGNCVLVKLGKSSKKIHHEKYKLACFINGFELSYKNRSDHHVKAIEIACDIDENNLIEDQGDLFAKVFVKSLLTDNGRNNFDVPHNSVSGFVVAFKNDNQ